MWPARLEQWRRYVEAAAAATALDPCLIAAIMDRESLGGVGLSPKGPSGTGDHGYGLGLMQLDRRFHPDLTEDQWQDPSQNILLGAMLLRSNLDNLNQNLPAAICAYNASIERVKALLIGLTATARQLDLLTTGKNYVSDVLDRQEKLVLADRRDPPQSVPPPGAQS